MKVKETSPDFFGFPDPKNAESSFVLNPENRSVSFSKISLYHECHTTSPARRCYLICGQGHAGRIEGFKAHGWQKRGAQSGSRAAFVAKVKQSGNERLLVQRESRTSSLFLLNLWTVFSQIITYLRNICFLKRDLYFFFSNAQKHAVRIF